MLMVDNQVPLDFQPENSLKPLSVQEMIIWNSSFVENKVPFIQYKLMSLPEEISGHNQPLIKTGNFGMMKDHMNVIIQIIFRQSRLLQ